MNAVTLSRDTVPSWSHHLWHLESCAYFSEIVLDLGSTSELGVPFGSRYGGGGGSESLEGGIECV